MANGQPLVSILLLSMNHEQFIVQCIESLKSQTYKNIEIIYLDNASSDATYQMAQSLLEQSGFPYKCFQQQPSRSISANLNFLFENSSGEYISPLSTDDWFEPNNIEEKVNYLADHASCGAVFSNGWTYYDAEKQLELNDVNLLREGHLYREVLTHPGCVFYVGMLYKRSILEKVGKWDESLKIEDVDMYIRIGLIATINFLTSPLVYYRRTSTSVSKNKDFMIAGFNQYFDKYKTADWINMKHWLSEKYRSLAADAVDHKNNGEARSFLLEAFKLNPWGAKNCRTLLYYLRRSLTS